MVLEPKYRLDGLLTPSPTCPGLCGNFNQNQADDFRTLSGVVEGTAAAFANTWKTQATCPNVKNSFEDPCSLSVENGTPTLGGHRVTARPHRKPRVSPGVWGGRDPAGGPQYLGMRVGSKVWGEQWGAGTPSSGRASCCPVSTAQAAGGRAPNPVSFPGLRAPTEHEQDGGGRCRGW